MKSFEISNDEKDIGMYVGLIASSFSVAQFLTSILWGHLSDRIGRRPVMLIGLFGNFISMILFGFSQSLGWAIFSRALCGILNGKTIHLYQPSRQYWRRKMYDW